MKLLAVLADGLGYHYLREPSVAAAYVKVTPHAIPLRTELGYSAGLHPVIWSGLNQEDLPYWSKWGVPNGPTPAHGRLAYSPLAWKMTAVAKTLMRDIGRVPGIYDPAVPSIVKKTFSKLEADDAVPFRHAGAVTLFDALDHAKLQWRYHFCPKEKHLPGRVAGPEDVSILLYGGVDGAGHDHGPHDPKTLGSAVRFASWLERQRRDFDDIIVFSDHGMYPVNARIDYGARLRKAIKADDLLVFLDATIIRLWWRNEATGRQVRELVSTWEGTVVENRDFPSFGIPAGRTFGDLMFVPPGGVEVYPNYFHPIYPQWFMGLHGYMPDGPYSAGAMLSTRPLRAPAGHLRDVTPTLISVLQLSSDPSWKGTSLV